MLPNDYEKNPPSAYKFVEVWRGHVKKLTGLMPGFGDVNKDFKYLSNAMSKKEFCSQTVLVKCSLYSLFIKCIF